jgi:GxxExxY protein
MGKIIYPKLSYEIIGHCLQVHQQLGGKYQEKYYHRALEEKFKKSKIPFKSNISVDLKIDGEKIGKYILDFIIRDKVVLELKATPRLTREDFRQVSVYLKSANLKLGIIANFRGEKLVFRRILNSGYTGSLRE